VDPAIDFHDWRLRTAAQARYFVELELAIRRDLSRPDPDDLLDLLRKQLPALDVTRRPQANPHLVIPGLLEPELGIKGGHPIHLRFRYAEIFCDLDHGGPGDISILTLAILQDGNQLVGLLQKLGKVNNIFIYDWRNWICHEIPYFIDDCAKNHEDT
jgi:hypothetical protein